MATLNNCRFIGRLGKKAEIRQMSNGKSVASFSLAVDESYKKDGEKVSKTEWINVVVFSEGLVKVIENYTDKGTQIYLEGKMQTRKWTDKDGVDKWTTEIVLQGFNSVIQLLESKKGDIDQHSVDKGNGYAPKEKAKTADEVADEYFPDDEIGF
jgi:single-strand DNA-binding protein